MTCFYADPFRDRGRRGGDGVLLPQCGVAAPERAALHAGHAFARGVLQLHDHTTVTTAFAELRHSPLWVSWVRTDVCRVNCCRMRPGWQATSGSTSASTCRRCCCCRQAGMRPSPSRLCSAHRASTHFCTRCTSVTVYTLTSDIGSSVLAEQLPAGRGVHSAARDAVHVAGVWQHTRACGRTLACVGHHRTIASNSTGVSTPFRPGCSLESLVLNPLLLEH